MKRQGRYLNCLPIGSSDNVSWSHASATNHIFTSSDDEVNLEIQILAMLTRALQPHPLYSILQATRKNNKKIYLASTPRGLIWPMAFAAPRTAAEPPMSNFMSSIEQPGPVLIL